MKEKSKFFLLTLVVILISSLSFGLHSTLANPNVQKIIVHLEGGPLNITISYKPDGSSDEQTVELERKNVNQPFSGFISFEGQLPHTLYATAFIDGKEENYTLTLDEQGRGNENNGDGTLVYWGQANATTPDPTTPDPTTPDPTTPDPITPDPTTPDPTTPNPTTPDPTTPDPTTPDPTTPDPTTPVPTPTNPTPTDTTQGTQTTNTQGSSTTQPQTGQASQQEAVQTVATVNGGELPTTAGPWMNWLLLSGLLALGSSATLFMKFRKL